MKTTVAVSNTLLDPDKTNITIRIISERNFNGIKEYFKKRNINIGTAIKA